MAAEPGRGPTAPGFAGRWLGGGELVIATGNAGKLAEFRRLFEPLDIHCIGQHEAGVSGEADETAATFIENALLKARYASAQTGAPALADDSGLCVPALHGAPGIHSARYAGSPGAGPDHSANIARLLAELELAGASNAAERAAHFHCSLALVRYAEDPDPLIAQGRWHGSIALQPSGSGGFGYDPVFIDSATGLTAAELDPADKARRSHRGQALGQLVSLLEPPRAHPVRAF